VTFSTHVALIATVAVTTACWLLTAYLGPQTDRAVLVRFYRLVKPFGPGWKPVQREARLSAADEAVTHENIPMALLGWVAGCTTIWSSLFAVGNFLYGRIGPVLLLTCVFAVSATVLVRVVTRLWAGSPAEPSRLA
jgi:SSS family solute:Na+ symporter